MSIAVSVAVKPSRLLLMMVSGMSIASMAIGSLIGLGTVGDLSDLARLIIAVLSVFLALFGFYHTVRNQKRHHIDISGSGQFRLREDDTPSGSCQEKNWPHVKGNADAVQLLSDSTIWPHLLLLRLKADNGKITVVPILPDCVSRDGFRALSVACRWIATQSDSQDQKKL